MIRDVIMREIGRERDGHEEMNLSAAHIGEHSIQFCWGICSNFNPYRSSKARRIRSSRY
jgi:hypothetical protein